MQNNSRKVQKTPVFVEIVLADDSKMQGKLYLTPQERLIDTLNDDRSFLPLETMDGTGLALAKTAIKQVVLPATYSSPYRGRDPYLILGVSERISNEKLKQAYHQLCMNSHPDRIKGFGLGMDFQELASQNMTRINDAYSQILRMRKGAIGEALGVDGNSDHLGQRSAWGRHSVAHRSPSLLRRLRSSGSISKQRSVHLS
jgi:hypothetical protein